METRFTNDIDFFKSFEMGEDGLLKARQHKYFRREGSPGKYKYYYTESQYEKAKEKSEKSEKTPQLKEIEGKVFRNPAIGESQYKVKVEKVDNGKITYKNLKTGEKNTIGASDFLGFYIGVAEEKGEKLNQKNIEKYKNDYLKYKHESSEKLKSSLENMKTIYEKEKDNPKYSKESIQNAKERMEGLKLAVAEKEKQEKEQKDLLEKQSGKTNIPKADSYSWNEPYDKKVYTKLYQEALQDKKWAEEKKNDKKWLENAGEMAKDMLKERSEKTAEQLAKESYKYFRMRAGATTASGQLIDHAAFSDWVNISGKKPEPVGKKK